MSRLSLTLFFCLLASLFSLSAGLPSETIYLTWIKSPTRSMTIQWISQTSQKEALTTVSFRKKGNEDWVTRQGTSFSLYQGSPYRLHQIELDDLAAATRYDFKVAPDETIYSFSTLPETLAEGLKFVVGGDMYHDDISFVEKTSSQAAKRSPAFAVIGGDIAYAFPRMGSTDQNIPKWVEWIKSWHRTMVTPEGDFVPVIAAIGNHDLPGQFLQNPKKAIVYRRLFPLCGERVYGVFDVGSYLSIFLLDSGHANRVLGEQKKWLKKELEERENVLYKFAVYHVGAYPSVRPFKNRRASIIRRHWVPLFEQFGVQTAFEHHDHAYKRTFPLIQGQKSSKGVVYLGDGGWGVEKPKIQKDRKKRDYLAAFFPRRHFILVDLKIGQQEYQSISDEGEVLDRYVR